LHQDIIAGYLHEPWSEWPNQQLQAGDDSDELVDDGNGETQIGSSTPVADKWSTMEVYRPLGYAMTDREEQ